MNARTGVHCDAYRYLLAGVLNTLCTSLVYFILLNVAQPSLAYGVAWLLGLFFVVKFYPEKVFVAGSTGWSDRAWLGGVTAANFLLGIFMLNRLIATGLDPQLAFLGTLIATTVVGFFLSRLLLRRTDRT